MTELAYIVAVVALLVGGAWLWRRFGKGVVITAAIALAVVAGLLEALARRGQRKDKPGGSNDTWPSPSDERLRRELSEALKSGEQRLVEARKDGTAALKDELRKNRLEREG